MTIETFLPSEVARLVLGYLAEIGCQKSHETFLSECNDLREYASLMAGGLKFSTNVGGKSLLDVLAEYCALSRQAPPATKDPSTQALLASSNQTGDSAGAVYRAARQVLSLTGSSAVPQTLQQPQSCPPQGPNTPTVASTPYLAPPMTCTAAPSSVQTLSPNVGRKNAPPVRHKYGACNNPTLSPTLRTPGAIQQQQQNPSTSGVVINNAEDSLPAPNSISIDPLAGIGSMDPLFDFARTLAENINTVIAKEDNSRNDPSFISPEKAGQIIEMTEHDPNFDRFVRSLFQGDNSLPFDNTMDGQDLIMPLPPQQPIFQPQKQQPQSTVSVAMVVDSLIESTSNQQQPSVHVVSTQPTTPPPPSVSEHGDEERNNGNRNTISQSDQQIDGVGLLNVGNNRKRSRGRNPQPDQGNEPRKKGRPLGRRDRSQRNRSCKIRDPLAPQPPPPPPKPIDPATREILKAMPPVMPKLPIPRLPRSVPLAPIATPLSVLFGNGGNLAASPGSFYLMDPGTGNLMMVSISQQQQQGSETSPQKQQQEQQQQEQQQQQEMTANLPTRVIISPAEEENTQKEGVTNATEIVVASDLPSGSTAAAPIVISDQEEPAHQMQPSNCGGILDSIGFDDLFYNSKSPHRFMSGNINVFNLGLSESKLRTPPGESQPSFLANFGTSAVASPPIARSVRQCLNFDDAVLPPVQQPIPVVLQIDVTPNKEKPQTPAIETCQMPPIADIRRTSISPVFLQAGQTPKSATVKFQSTSDSQQQSGRVLRRVPLVPVPTTSTPVQPLQIPPPPNPNSSSSSNIRRTRSTANREAVDFTASTSSSVKTDNQNAKRRRD